jgi:hypothetical protein
MRRILLVVAVVGAALTVVSLVQRDGVSVAMFAAFTVLLLLYRRSTTSPAAERLRRRSEDAAREWSEHRIDDLARSRRLDPANPKHHVRLIRALRESDRRLDLLTARNLVTGRHEA